MKNELTQSTLVMNPPYGTRFVDHLHHKELLFSKGDVLKVLDWLQGLQREIVNQYTDTIKSSTKPCTNCKAGYILNTEKTNEVFPDGIPVLCPICNGTTVVEINDIIDEEPTVVVNVVPDDGTIEVMKPE